MLLKMKRPEDSKHTEGLGRLLVDSERIIVVIVNLLLWFAITYKYTLHSPTRQGVLREITQNRYPHCSAITLAIP